MGHTDQEALYSWKRSALTVPHLLRGFERAGGLPRSGLSLRWVKLGRAGACASLKGVQCTMKNTNVHVYWGEKIGHKRLLSSIYTERQKPAADPLQQCLWQDLTASLVWVGKTQISAEPLCERLSFSVSNLILGALLAGGSEGSRLEELQPSTLVQTTAALCELWRWAAGEALFPVVSHSLPALQWKAQLYLHIALFCRTGVLVVSPARDVPSLLPFL